MTDRLDGPEGPIGVLGGTFDPIHVGHLLVAEQARDALGLSRVLFVPAGEPPHKAPGTVTAAERRASMVALAIDDEPDFELSRVELDRSGPSYMADTVELLATQLGSARGPADLVLILSSDAFRELAGWRDPRRILTAARLAVLPRGGHPAPEASWLGPDLADLVDRLTVLDAPRLTLSGHEIRARVAAGRSIRQLVRPAVRGYIEDHGLYRAPGRPAADPLERTQNA